MRFSYKGNNIEVSEQRKLYNKIFIEYQDRSNDAEESFSSRFDNEFRCMEDVIKHAPEIAMELIDKNIEYAVDDLIGHGAYDIDYESFCEEYYCDYDSWDHYFGLIQDQYNEISLEGEELDAYRKGRRENRGRIIGGGFGVEGAVNGIIMAGAANAAIGAAHMVFNGIGKIFSGISKNNALRKIFENAETKKILCYGVKDAVLGIHKAHFDALVNLGKVDASGAISEEDIAKSEKMLGNLMAGKIPHEKTPDVLAQLITINPYNQKIYLYALNTFGDPDNGLHAIANFFGVDLSHLKKQLLNELEIAPSLESEEEIGTAIAAIESKAAALNYYEPIPKIAEFKEKLAILDEQARTVDGEVYGSREAATLAAKEKVEIMSLVSSTNFEDENSVQLALKELSSRSYTFKGIRSDIEKLNKIAETLEIKARTVNNKVYSTREEADVARLELAKLKSIMNDCDMLSKKGILETIDIINRTNFEKIDPVEKIDELVARHQEIDECERTLDEDLYSTKDEFDMAFLEKEEIDKIIKTVWDDKNKLIDAIQGLSSKNFVNKRSEQKLRKLKKNLEEVLEKEKTFDGVVYDSVEEAYQAKIDYETEKKVFEKRHEIFEENIIGKYLTDKKNSFFVYPEFDLGKVKYFVKECRRLFNFEIQVDDIGVYFDETLLGTGDKGVAITLSDVIITVDKIGAIKLSEIESASVSGMINKKITLSLKDGDSSSFVLTQGNKGALALAEIINMLASVEFEQVVQ